MFSDSLRVLIVQINTTDRYLKGRKKNLKSNNGNVEDCYLFIECNQVRKKMLGQEFSLPL